MDPQHPPSRSQHSRLLEKYGAYCQGCGCDFTDNPSALEVDHIWPRSEGGTDAYENLTLLCPPCNRTKSDTMTITGLQQRNRREGILRPENDVHLKLGRGAKNKWRAAFAAVEELLAQEAPGEWAAYKTMKAQRAQDYEACMGRKLPDFWDVAGWRDDRSKDERLERKKAALKKAAPPDKYPDEWAAYEEYESKKAALETAAVKAEAQLARAYPDEWAAYKAFESQKARNMNLLAYATAFVFEKVTAAEYDSAKEKYEAVKAAVRAQLKAAMKVEAPEEWAAAPDEWKAYEKAYGEYDAVYKTQPDYGENAFELLTRVSGNVVNDKEGFLEVWRKIPLVHPTGWADSMADYRTNYRDYYRTNSAYEEYMKAYKEAKEAAYEAAYEEYKAMTPDEWMAEKIRHLRWKYEDAHPANEWEAAMKAAAPEEWKAYKEAKEAVDIQMVWAADTSYAREAMVAARNALVLAAPDAADAYFALREAYRNALARSERAEHGE